MSAADTLSINTKSQLYEYGAPATAGAFFIAKNNVISAPKPDKMSSQLIIFMANFIQISPQELDKFSQYHPDGNIHQTSMWADFQANVPGREKCTACGIKDGEKLRSAGLFVRQKLPLGLCWYFAPRGPLLGCNDDLELMVDGIKKVEPKCVFVRIESARSN